MQMGEGQARGLFAAALLGALFCFSLWEGGPSSPPPSEAVESFSPSRALSREVEALGFEVDTQASTGAYARVAKAAVGPEGLSLRWSSRAGAPFEFGRWIGRLDCRRGRGRRRGRRRGR